MVITLLLTVAAFVIIFVAVGGYSQVYFVCLFLFSHLRFVSTVRDVTAVTMSGQTLLEMLCSHRAFCGHEFPVKILISFFKLFIHSLIHSFIGPVRAPGL